MKSRWKRDLKTFKYMLDNFFGNFRILDYWQEGSHTYTLVEISGVYHLWEK